MACAGDGAVAPAELAELERQLGPGAVPPQLKPDVIVADLPSRVAQVLRDLCIIARADGDVSQAELDIITDIAVKVEVDLDLDLVSCVLDPTSGGCGSG